MPQLLSRILIRNSEVIQVLKKIIVEIIKCYPRQSLWYLFGISNSKPKEDIIATISGVKANFSLDNSTDTSQRLKPLVDSAIQLTSELNKLASADAKAGKSKLQDFKFNKKVLPCGLVVPVQLCMRVTMPSNGSSSSITSVPTPSAGMPHTSPLNSHIAFPRHSIVTIFQLEESVDTMPSLKKPKRIVMIGSNGVRYKILCKADDDVRKDSRFMDVTGAIDYLLQQNEASFKRQLFIRSYFVTPLGESSGLIEWVDGMSVLRQIIEGQYNNLGIPLNWTVIRNLFKPVGQEMIAFKECLKMYPSVLQDWFLENFPEPSAWLDGRNTFAKSLAVMSMVGFIFGLGDRHGENILLDVNTGAIMHVDFDCLFDKGKEMEAPELVPFRLTHNLVSALGVFGYEGIFRKSSEVTLQLVRDYEDMIMTMLDVFLHDPINDWSRRKRTSKNKTRVKGFGAARSPEEALSIIRNKIRGSLMEEVMPMKVPGQVSYLIAEATDEQNLAYMYIGWMAYW